MIAVTIGSCLGTIGLAIALTSISGMQSANRGYAGEAFGAAAAASSVIVLIYIARTFHQQGEESRLMRKVAQDQHQAARVASQAAMREQHHHLIQMAIDDPLLMEVWPGWETGYLADNEVENTLHHMFSSHKVQEFWERTRVPRDLSSPHSGGMREFYDHCELAYQRQILGLATRPDSDDLAEPR